MKESGYEFNIEEQFYKTTREKYDKLKEQYGCAWYLTRSRKEYDEWQRFELQYSRYLKLKQLLK